ncbi:acyl carrier protein [Xenorhabdus khoisanae]|uniref:acyl carrier protein n=1 Tax=Xenorhabdus khoisanae TaxID=880157 RepID=UPI0032B791B1
MKLAPNDLKQWLIECVARYCRLKPSDIKDDVSFTDYGMDSVFTLTIIGEIEDQFGIELAPTAIWDNPTIEKLYVLLDSEINNTAT